MHATFPPAGVVDEITTAEACDILNRHPSWVSRKVRSEELTPTRKLAGKRGAFLFNRADVEALAARLAAVAS